MTAWFNGVEELGRDECFVCLELDPSNGSFLNSKLYISNWILIYFTRTLQLPAPFNTCTSSKSRREPGCDSKCVNPALSLGFRTYKWSS
ncbi:TUBA1C isoform 8 [Pan troglodytes]|uniref:TUBA1C isoform 4 n=1 Tax=Pan troglodytes TaxID=9598 RepID=A0A2J8LPY9_PANTR|nr:TUBA1C isoform 4 [Pan troglodytes]PNI49335.1 TUBA1C isoform 8 [Pan troglodytes]